MRACACGLRRIAANSIPGRDKSSVYIAAPVISRGSSRRRIPDPKIRELMASSLLCRERGRGIANGAHDVLIARAAAHVAVEALPDLAIRRVGIRPKELVR